MQLLKTKDNKLVVRLLRNDPESNFREFQIIEIIKEEFKYLEAYEKA